MPVYDYRCPAHGIFHELNETKFAGQPKPCPDCQTLAPQVILVAPTYLNMEAQKRVACACNEKAQHEPLKSSQLLRPTGSMTKSSQTFILPDGNQILMNQRPWMISH